MRKMILAAAFMLLGLGAQAQQKILRWVAECQADSSIEMKTVISKTNGRIVELVLPVGSPRNREFLDVLDSERDNASQLVEKRESNKAPRITSCRFDLDSSDDPESLMLIIDYKSNGDIVVKARRLQFIGG